MIPNNNGRVNEFPPTLFRELTNVVQRVADEAHSPLFAAFDADGTLWDTDAGETFFDYQIEHCELPNMPGDPWKHYLDLKKIDPPTAYAWLAQINKGQTLTQVRAWAKACFARRMPFPVFESQRRLIATLHELGYEIFIVTASVKWAVEPVASLVGVDFDHVLGITTEIADGVVTDKAVLPITWRQGKADALLRATGGIRPVICSGNTFGDIALLDTATHIQLAVSTQDARDTGLYHEEEKLREEATRRGWHMHLFRPID